MYQLIENQPTVFRVPALSSCHRKFVRRNVGSLKGGRLQAGVHLEEVQSSSVRFLRFAWKRLMLHVN